jgi:hypothetical protein
MAVKNLAASLLNDVLLVKSTTYVHICRAQGEGRKKIWDPMAVKGPAPNRGCWLPTWYHVDPALRAPVPVPVSVPRFW